MAVFVSNLRSALPQTFDWLLTSDTTAAVSLSSKAGSHVRRGDYMFSLLFVTHQKMCIPVYAAIFFSLPGTGANPAVNSRCQKIG
jgi:hypothetical protein